MTKAYKTSGAIVVHRHGPPDVLKWERVDLTQPQAGEVLVKHTAVGLNFIDVYHREGLYPLELPFTPGVEGAGVIEDVGPGVAGLRQGDRVAYTGNGPPGSYTEWRVMAASRLVKLPAEIDEVAFVTEPRIIDRILDHLRRTAPARPRPRAPPRRWKSAVTTSAD